MRVYDNSYDAVEAEAAWRREAKCHWNDGVGPRPAFFYRETGCGAEVAKRYCWGADDGVRCSVMQQCLETAIRTNELYGVWGGQGQRDRDRIRQVWLKEGGKIRPLPGTAPKPKLHPTRFGLSKGAPQ